MFNKLFNPMFAVVMTLGLALGFVACEKDDADKTPNDLTIELSTANLAFTMEEGSQEVTITSNGAWSVAVAYTDGADWLTVTPIEGKNDGKVTVMAHKNESGAARKATVKVTVNHPKYGPWATQSIEVLQSATADEVEVGEGSISAALKVKDGEVAKVNRATVVAICKNGFLMDDVAARMFVYIYNMDVEGLKIGSVVSVEGTISSYNNFKQFAAIKDEATGEYGDAPVVTILEQGEYTQPTPEVMDAAAMDAFVATPSIKYVEYTGLLSVSGDYYNVIIEGATKSQGSLLYPNAEDIKAVDGQMIKVTGWVAYVNSGKYVNTIVVSTEAVGEAPKEEELGPNDTKIVFSEQAEFAEVTEDVVIVGKEYTFEEFKFAFTKVNNSDSKYAVDDKGIRFYKKDIMTVTAPEGKLITKIAFKVTPSHKGPVTCDKGTYDEAAASWSGKVKNVSFTAVEQMRFTHVVITTTEDDGTVPDDGGDTPGDDEGEGGDTPGTGEDTTPADYSYVFTSKVFTENGTQTLGELDWTLTTDTSYLSYYDDSGMTIGKAAEPCTYLTLKSNGFTKGVTKVVINARGAKDTNAKCTVTVGGQQLGSEASLTNVATDYTFESTEALTGEIVISFTQTSAKAIYITGFAINGNIAATTPDDGGNEGDDDVTPEEPLGPNDTKIVLSEQEPFKDSTSEVIVADNTYTFEGFTFAFVKNGSKDSKYIQENIRLYKQDTVIITAPEGKTITQIAVTITNTNKVLTPNVGEYDATTYVWTGSSNSVELTASEGVVYFSQMVITAVDAN